MFQSGLPAMNVEILGQFPSPPVPNLPALAMAMAPVMPQHQQPMMTQPPVSMSMPMPTPAPPVMPMAPTAPAQPPTNTNFIASFPLAQVTANLLFFLCVYCSWLFYTSYLLTKCLYRQPKQMTMTSRTSRRHQRQEQTRPSLTSRASQEQVSPAPLHFNSKTGTGCQCSEAIRVWRT